jgi:O-acetyl-ADP-ribose deacetylase (regulator of RNase III)
MNDESLDKLLGALLEENKSAARLPIPPDTAGKEHLLRALMNVRPPLPLEPGLLVIQDQVLAAQRERKGVIAVDSLPTVQEQFGPSRLPCAGQLVLWQGDITRLAVGAIVNAANNKLLGCFVPHHRCIDNAIHSAAGMQLRQDCADIMRAQGFDEPTGQAKITAGYNLPARYVLHTVGPIIYGGLTQEDRRLLAACYTACLDQAAQAEIDSLAFCCISTGEFRFPKAAAAQIALQTVCDWLARGPNRMRRVIFNVFTQEDYVHYTDLFKQS